MDLYIYEWTVNGFADGEFDLQTLFNRAPEKQDPFIAAIIDPIVDVLRTPNVGAALSVAGHADRYDATSNHIQCLAVEKSASEKRVLSAIAHIQYLVQQREPSAPADLNSLAYFDVNLRAPGAGVLEESDPDLSSDQRLKNRRIQARLLVFKP